MNGNAPSFWRQMTSQSRRNNSSALKALVDVGSSKLCCYIAQNQGPRGFAIIGRGYQAADGLIAGNVDDVQAALESLLATVNEAEEQAGEQLRSVDVVWSGGSPRTRLLALDHDLTGRQVQEDDLEAMLKTARRETGLDERIALKVAGTEARIDNGRPMGDPVGIAGNVLTLDMAVTSVEVPAFNDLVDLFAKAHLDVETVTNGTQAAAAACLTAEEAMHGALIVDMGGGATSVGLIHDGRLIHADQVPYGGDHVSRDVAIGLNTSQAFGERLKSLYGSVQQRSCDDNMWIDVPLIDDQVDQPSSEVPRSKLTLIVRARVAETFKLLQSRLQDVMPLFDERPPRSVVLTGGACQIEGMVEMAEELFGLPARIARQDLAQGPRGLEDQPCCSAASGGLIMAAYDDHSLIWQPAREAAAWSGGLHRMQRWLKENFAS